MAIATEPAPPNALRFGHADSGRKCSLPARKPLESSPDFRFAPLPLTRWFHSALSALCRLPTRQGAAPSQRALLSRPAIMGLPPRNPVQTRHDPGAFEPAAHWDRRREPATASRVPAYCSARPRAAEYDPPCHGHWDSLPGPATALRFRRVPRTPPPVRPCSHPAVHG